jgi:hypothetical protein
LFGEGANSRESANGGESVVVVSTALWDIGRNIKEELSLFGSGLLSPPLSDKRFMAFEFRTQRCVFFKDVVC